MKPIGLVRRDKAAWLIVYTWAFKLLNQATRQAAPPIWPGDLQCGRALTHSLGR